VRLNLESLILAPFSVTQNGSASESEWECLGPCTSLVGGLESSACDAQFSSPGDSMPRRKKSAAAKAEQPSRAELIRQTAQSLGRRVRPRDIIAALKDKGVTVSSTLVSKTLAAAGFRRRRRRRKLGAGAEARQAMSAGGSLNLDALIAAKALIEKVGGVENAQAALSGLKRLQ
jgi:hypothetical protein